MKTLGSILGGKKKQPKTVPVTQLAPQEAEKVAKFSEAPEIKNEEIVYSEADVLGEGTFGVVYKGRCRGCQVAIKVHRCGLVRALFGLCCSRARALPSRSPNQDPPLWKR